MPHQACWAAVKKRNNRWASLLLRRQRQLQTLCFSMQDTTTSWSIQMWAVLATQRGRGITQMNNTFGVYCFKDTACTDPRSSGKLPSHFAMHVASSLSQTFTVSSPKTVTPPTLPAVQFLLVPLLWYLEIHTPSLPHHTSQEHAHHFYWHFLASALTHPRILPEAFWSVWWRKHIHQGAWCTCRQIQIPPHRFFLVPGTPSCSGKPCCSLSEDISTGHKNSRHSMS